MTSFDLFLFAATAIVIWLAFRMRETHKAWFGILVVLGVVLVTISLVAISLVLGHSTSGTS